jgi:hypothetical protein
MPPLEPLERVSDAGDDAEPEDAPPRARSGYSRPPAPALSFSKGNGASLEELAASATSETELDEDDAFDDEDDALDDDARDEDEDALDDDARDEDEDALDDDARDEDDDAFDDLPLDDALLGSTLESVPSDEPSTRRLRPAVMVEEADELDELDDDRLMRESQATLAPVVEELADGHDRELPPPSLTPAQRARRSRLRRGVGIAVGAVALLAIGLATKAIVSKPSAQSAAEQATPAVALAEAPAAEDQAATEAAEEPTPSDAFATTPAVDSSLDEPTLESDYAKVRKQTLELLNRAKFEQAALWARRLIELEPTEAFGYRCLGSALQDMGRAKEAREVYSQCVQNATKGEIYECSALGGRVKKR